MKKALSITWSVAEPLLALWAFLFVLPIALGQNGIWETAFAENAVLKMTLYTVLMTHLTIAAMSICFHRAHTHQAIKLHPAVDAAMQIWLWLTTSMAKLDWVSIHVYHHTTSDTEKDPHSPKQKGLARIFFFGVYDYVVAKSDPEVMKIRKRIPENRLESFIDKHHLLGPILTAAILGILFGPSKGMLLAGLTFLISPFFAVGGVNGFAHYFGYRNHRTTDNSRNLGFVFPLNWMISGELDHNNHHAFPRSASFSHRWYEFDIGYAYITLLKWVGLCEVKHVYRRRKEAVLDSVPVAVQVAKLG
ncbi:MAG: hypothetical protein JNL01_17075 [Bdellovibrionales bacterium]|nr:hypothetical protein [Bdellovibrionales bacterium]